jgi:hypothetical protein
MVKGEKITRPVCFIESEIFWQHVVDISQGCLDNHESFVVLARTLLEFQGRKLLVFGFDHTLQVLVFVKQVPIHKNPEIEFFFQILGVHLGNFSVLTAVEVFALLLS